jgi:ribonucleoside-diphosphate reductase alpha chain
LFGRVANNISRAELKYGSGEANRCKWEKVFFEAMMNLEFLPNSPTLMNAGTDLQQLSACFVLPVEDSMESIFESVKNAALIHKSGGGTGFSFSRLRPKDDFVQTTKGVSSGPVSFMGVFDAATETVKQGGKRRGANMAVLRVDHPDIEDFIAAKTDLERLTNFNISVAVTEEFMRAVENGTDYSLVSPRTGLAEKSVSARKVFDSIVGSAWQNGEPGIIFIDRMNADNPTPHVGAIESTNPCGEQPLLPYESCNLGSLNLNSVVDSHGDETSIDYDRLARNVHIGVRFLDNVIDMNRYPVQQIDDMTKANRKIGLGVMGFADMLIRLGIPYDSEEAVEIGRKVMSRIRVEARLASQELAEERGCFPNFRGSVYDQPGQPPIRNATTTTIAPTGTISIIANASSGIEPLFAVAYVRNVLDGQELVEANPLFEEVARREGFWSEDLSKEVADAGSVRDIEAVPEYWRTVFRTSHDIGAEAHIRMQAGFQEHTDNAVSKTANLPEEATTEDVEKIFWLAHTLNCKGVTIYRNKSRTAQVLNIGGVNHDESGNGSNGKTLKTPRKRQDVLVGRTRRQPTGCGNMYVTVNDDGERPFELFAQIGKAGGCAASQAEAIGRLVSLAMRANVDPAAIAKQLRGVRCPSPAWDNGKIVMSCADGISKALERHLMEKQDFDADVMDWKNESMVNRCAGLCIDCGNPLEFDGGCSVCRLCGFSRCG